NVADLSIGERDRTPFDDFTIPYMNRGTGNRNGFSLAFGWINGGLSHYRRSAKDKRKKHKFFYILHHDLDSFLVNKIVECFFFQRFAVVQNLSSGYGALCHISLRFSIQ